MPWKSILSVFLFTILASPIAQSEALSNYRAEIKAMSERGIKLKAEGFVEFQSNGNNWSLEVAAKGGPLKSRDYSRGEMIDGVYRPLNFEREVKVLLYKERIQWHYDWSANKVRGSVQGDELQYNLDTIVHDQISFQMALRQALMRDETQMEFSFFSYKRPTDLKFEVIGEELLSIGNGRTHTLILKQTAPVRQDEKKLVWVSTDHDYIPVRFTTFKKDKIKDDIIVTKLWINDKAVQFNR